MSHLPSSSMIGRVVSLLDAVAAGVSNRRDLAGATGLPQATCNRILTRLLAERLLIERPDGISLGLKLFELGTQAAQSGVTLLDIVSPYLVDLHGALGCTAQLAVLDDGMVTYLIKADSYRLPRLGTRLAQRFPLHCTGGGKALLAFSPHELVDGLLARISLVARTPATITSPARLVRELRATARRGYAIDRGEFQDGMTGVAVPIRPRERLLAALTLTGPTESFEMMNAVHAARVVANMVSTRLRTQPYSTSYQPPNAPGSPRR